MALTIEELLVQTFGENWRKTVTPLKKKQKLNENPRKKYTPCNEEKGPQQ